MPPDALPVPRELIEAHIREKGVTKVPRGASGIFDEQGNYINNPLRASRPSGRPRKAPPPAPKPDPAPEPHLPARRANVERFAAAMEAEPKAPEKPQEPRTAAVRAPAPEGRPRRGAAPREEIRNRYRALHAEGKSLGEIADALGVSKPAVCKMLAKLGLTVNRPARGRPQSATTPAEPKKPNPKRPGRNGAADVKKAERAERHAGIVADRRRFRTVSVPMGEPAVELAPDHEAVTEGRTYFPSRVFEPSAEDRVLIDGCNNSKIGGDVLVGWLKGARIYTLTLEERATCPRECPIFRGCYGNAMQWSRRWRHGPALERRIAAEVRQLCKAHDRILIRLHVLGDFYSVDYVQFWQGLLIEHPGLHVFGFTAWPEDSEIGSYVAAVRAAFPRRWWVRHSGRTGPWGSFTIDFPTAKKRIGDALVCPEQRDGMQGSKEGRHCGNCAACWSSDVPIVFVEH